MHDVITCIITYDSKLAVCICFESHESFHINAYSLRDKTHAKIFSIPIEGEYLKMNLIEQTDCG